MIYLGTIGWRYQHWTKSFYSTPIPERWLSIYGQKAGFVEVKSTISDTVPENIVAKWYADTPSDFIFSVNVPRTITFRDELKVNERAIENFLTMIKPLDQKCGILMLQFSKKMQFSEDTQNFVFEVLDGLRSGFQGYFVLDMGNRSWNKDEFYNAISSKEATLLSTDKRPLSLIEDKSDIYYLNLSGDTRIIPKNEFGKASFPREDDIKQWAKHLKIKSKRYKRVFVSIGNHFSGDATQDAYLLRRELSKYKLKIHGFKDR